MDGLLWLLLSDAGIFSTATSIFGCAVALSLLSLVASSDLGAAAGALSTDASASVSISYKSPPTSIVSSLSDSMEEENAKY